MAPRADCAASEGDELGGGQTDAAGNGVYFGGQGGRIFFFFKECIVQRAGFYLDGLI
jgi:hypothetical protein